VREVEGSMVEWSGRGIGRMEGKGRGDVG